MVASTYRQAVSQLLRTTKLLTTRPAGPVQDTAQPTILELGAIKKYASSRRFAPLSAAELERVFALAVVAQRQAVRGEDEQALKVVEGAIEILKQHALRHAAATSPKKVSPKPRAPSVKKEVDILRLRSMLLGKQFESIDGQTTHRRKARSPAASVNLEGSPRHQPNKKVTHGDGKRRSLAGSPMEGEPRQQPGKKVVLKGS